MELQRHPELADRLAAAYALGTLRGGARRRFETLARQSPGLRARALSWQERLAAMTELQTGENPSPNVWKRIEIALRQEASPARAAARPRADAPAFWRRAAWAGALAGVLGFTLAGYAAWQLQGASEIRYVAMLQDAQAEPALLVTFDARQRTLTLRRLGGFREGAGRALELWALPEGGTPRSLGLLERDGVVRLPARIDTLREVPALAVSLEPAGGAPAGGGPTGPVLFKGPWLPTT